ncbi:hypothetical protein C8R45DRAFT_95263 [Mycena sanguinolenta]|nr:hypothetical protein C8R45DRAFT_95263 [Mycena sanguinolenta]
MHTFVSQLEMSFYPVPPGESLEEIGPITFEDALSLSVAAAGPCVVVSLITVFSSAPTLVAKAAIVPTSTIPALGICGVLVTVAACCLMILGGLYGFIGEYRARRPS